MDYEAFTRDMTADIRTSGRPTSGPMAGQPLMVLTTSGARTDEAREAIITYSTHGDRLVIAASKNAAPTNPAWYHNLRAHPEVTVETNREKFRARATVTSGEERDRLWEQHAAEFPWFQEYPEKTDRVIPMIFLDRID